MTRLQIADVLNKIMINNRFSIIERDNCHSKYESQINSMQKIFELQKQTDFTYLYAVSELLSDDFKNITNYLLDEKKDSPFIHKIKNPTREDKLLVATAFEENLEFFSMAWNWVAIVTAEIAEQDKNYTSNKNILLFKDFQDLKKSISKEIDYDIPVAAASETGFNNITRIQIDKLGELEIRGNRNAKRVYFALFLNPDFNNLQFELTIEFKAKEIVEKAVIRNDSKETPLKSKTIKVNFTNGFKITKITWNCL